MSASSGLQSSAIRVAGALSGFDVFAFDGLDALASNAGSDDGSIASDVGVTRVVTWMSLALVTFSSGGLVTGMSLGVGVKIRVIRLDVHPLFSRNRCSRRTLPIASSSASIRATWRRETPISPAMVARDGQH